MSQGLQTLCGGGPKHDKWVKRHRPWPCPECAAIRDCVADTPSMRDALEALADHFVDLYARVFPGTKVTKHKAYADARAALAAASGTPQDNAVSK